MLSFNKEVYVTVLHGDQRLKSKCMEIAIVSVRLHAERGV